MSLYVALCYLEKGKVNGTELLEKDKSAYN